MVYRIAQNLDYPVFYLAPYTVFETLGDDCLYPVSREPKRYLSIWKSMEITFQVRNKKDNIVLPDISNVSARLFFSEKAYNALYHLIHEHGEFLPVHYKEGKGYIFNTLAIAEEYNAVDKKMVINDVHGNLSHLSFVESKVKDIPIFKAEAVNYCDIYCNNEFKKVVVDAGLKGINFREDLAGVF